MTEAVALLCRTTERTADATAGVRELGEALGARIAGEPSTPRAGHWNDDLLDAQGCLREAGRIVDEALAGGRRPLLIAGHCAVCMTTLPAVVARHPGVKILWLDAHADFNTPESTPSDFLGGMCLAGACGIWDTELGLAPVDPRSLRLVGVRDVDPGEQELLKAHHVRTEPPRNGSVYVHLDLDVLDPSVHPADYPAPGGMTFQELTAVLENILKWCEIVGAEVTCPAPGHGARIAGTLAPLL
jgi:arginase family enzyme